VREVVRLQAVDRFMDAGGKGISMGVDPGVNQVVVRLQQAVDRFMAASYISTVTGITMNYYVNTCRV
jgi:hypothetical protein